MLFRELREAIKEHGIDVRTAVDDRALAEFHASELVFVDGRAISRVSHVDGDPDLRSNGEGTRLRTPQANFFLHC